MKCEKGMRRGRGEGRRGGGEEEEREIRGIGVEGMRESKVPEDRFQISQVLSKLNCVPKPQPAPIREKPRKKQGRRRRRRRRRISFLYYEE